VDHAEVRDLDPLPAADQDAAQPEGQLGVQAVVRPDQRRPHLAQMVDGPDGVLLVDDPVGPLRVVRLVPEGDGRPVPRLDLRAGEVEVGLGDRLGRE
jgi:hypothetical protein